MCLLLWRKKKQKEIVGVELEILVRRPKKVSTGRKNG